MSDYQRVGASPRLLEQPPQTLQLRIKETPGSWLLSRVLRPMWEWRLELALAITVALAWRQLSWLVGKPLAALSVVGTVGLLLGWQRFRTAAIAGLQRAELRRLWARGVRHAGLAVLHTDRIPRAVSITSVPAGEQLRVRFPAGSSVDLLTEQAETVAAFLGAREVRVIRDRDNARFADVTIVRRDPLGGSEALEWPRLNSECLSLWEPIPVGVDEDGQPVMISLVERNLLLGGEPGAGKSVALSLLVATAALDPRVEMTLLDGKLVELAAWSRCARHSVGVDVGEAIEVLKELQREMSERYVSLLANRKRKVGPDDDLPLHVVVCDELAHYLNSGDRKANAEFANLLRDLVSRGRAAGMIVLAATQKPSHDVIPTMLRDLFAFRWALRCTTPQASDTILGQGWASLDYSAATIDGSQRGVGFLLHEGGEPVRLRAFHLSDDDVALLADRAEVLRAIQAQPQLEAVEAAG